MKDNKLVGEGAYCLTSSRISATRSSDGNLRGRRMPITAVLRYGYIKAITPPLYIFAPSISFVAKDSFYTEAWRDRLNETPATLASCQTVPT